ncbi:hypothetical protein JCM6882_000770 [Rhodosporidiobolus microsporus]
MTDKRTEPCWICGTPTSTRCQACGTAGIDIFFCSKEHQKLVWAVHKLVCGPGKASPFLWPLLSQEEADDIFANLDYPFPLDDPETSARKQTSLVERVAAISDPPLGREHTLSLLRGATDETKWSNIPVLVGQEFLIRIRVAQFMRLSYPFVSSSPRANSRLRSAVVFCSTMLAYHIPLEEPQHILQGIPVSTRPAWWSKVAHRTLLAGYLSMGGRKRKAEEVEAAAYARREVQRVALEETGDSFPDKVQTLVSVLTSLEEIQ